MGRYLHLVFSDPPEGVADDEYNAWYDAHVEEILSVDGWRSAARYRVSAVVGADEIEGYRYLSVYELDVPPDVAVANLEASGMGDARAYLDSRGDDSPLPVPEWFTGIRFGSWNCTQVDEVTTAAG
jgi:hypothetical protein